VRCDGNGSAVVIPQRQCSLRGVILCWLLLLALLLLPFVTAATPLQPCWLQRPSPPGVVGAIGVARTLSLTLAPRHLARLRAIEQLAAGFDTALPIDQGVRAAVLNDDRQLSLGGATIYLIDEWQQQGYLYAYAALQPIVPQRCPPPPPVDLAHCEPNWICAPVQSDGVGVVAVSDRVGTPDLQFRQALYNGIQLLAYRYGADVSGSERYLRHQGGLGGMRLRFVDHQVQQSGTLPEQFRLQVRELRWLGDRLYLWLVSPDLPPPAIAVTDLTWRQQPNRDGVIGVIGSAGRSWDGLISTQIDLAMRDALVALAKLRGVGVESIDKLRRSRAGSEWGRSILITVQNHLRAQLLALYHDPVSERIDLWVAMAP